MKASSIWKPVLSTWLLVSCSTAAVSIDEAAVADSPTQMPCTTFSEWMPPRSDPAVVVQVLSRQYVQVEHNFIYHMERNSLFTRENLYIVCLDEESSIFLESMMGIRCAMSHYVTDVDRNNVWTVRVHVASCLILSGHDVLLSDADAIWLKDPMKDIKRLGAHDSDIVASRGIFPNNLSRVWGATLCFGFILFRSGGDAMSSFLQTVTKLVDVLHDDQAAVNRALHSAGIAWDGDSDMRLKNSTGRGRGVAGSAVPLVVTLLPHETFARYCDESTDFEGTTVVAHCISQAKGAKMSGWMEAAGVWNTRRAQVINSAQVMA